MSVRGMNEYFLRIPYFLGLLQVKASLVPLALENRAISESVYDRFCIMLPLHAAWGCTAAAGGAMITVTCIR